MKITGKLIHKKLKNKPRNGQTLRQKKKILKKSVGKKYKLLSDFTKNWVCDLRKNGWKYSKGSIEESENSNEKSVGLDSTDGVVDTFKSILDTIEEEF